MFLAIPAWRKTGTHYSLSKYSPGTSSCGTSCVRTSFLLAFPASSTPFTTSLSNAFPSSSNSSTLSESAPATLDNPCKSPDCRPELASRPFGGNATVSTLWLFSGICFLSALTVFAPIWTAFVFTAAFFGAGFFLADFFLGTPLFLSSFFVGVTFLPVALFDFVCFVCFVLVFFLAAIRAVYHRHKRSVASFKCRQVCRRAVIHQNIVHPQYQ